MRVLFNGTTLLKQRTGIAHAAAHLHAALEAAFPDDLFWLYPGATTSRIAKQLFAKSGKPNPPGTSSTRRLSHLAKGAISRIGKLFYTLHFKTAARLGRFDLYHEPNFVPFETGLPVVVTVFDLSVLLYPQWHPTERVKAHERFYSRGVKRARHVIVGTESVRNEALRHLSLAPDQVTAMFCGVGPQFRPQPPGAIAAIRGRYNLPKRYTLFVGTIEPRKNVATLLRAFSDLPADVRERCPLVLAGGWGWKAETERELFFTTARERGVIHIGYVHDEDLPALYAGAEALLYPSFYEGFGMPPVEAMACGTAAVTSTADAVREVVGRNALTIHPDDLAGWRDVLKLISRDPAALEEYRRGGQAHAARFTWERCAHIVHGVYRQVLGISGKPTAHRAAA